MQLSAVRPICVPSARRITVRERSGLLQKGDRLLLYTREGRLLVEIVRGMQDGQVGVRPVHRPVVDEQGVRIVNPIILMPVAGLADCEIVRRADRGASWTFGRELHA